MTEGRPDFVAYLDGQRRTVSDRCLSDFVLDAYLGGDLGQPRKGAADEHLTDCGRCRARLERLQGEAERFAVSGPPLVVPASSSAGGRGGAVAKVATWLAMAAAAALIVKVMPAFAPPGPAEATKGGGVTSLALKVFVRRAGSGRVEAVAPGEALAARDAIRFRLTPGEPGYAGVVGIDSAGSVTAYAPWEGSLSHIPAKIATTFPDSVVLDQTPGHERLVAVVCARPHEVRDVVAAAREALAAAQGRPERLGPLGLPCGQVTFSFRKAMR